MINLKEMIPVLIAYPQLGSGKVTGYPDPLQISEPKFRLSRNSNLDNMYPIKPYPIKTCKSLFSVTHEAGTEHTAF